MVPILKEKLKSKTVIYGSVAILLTAITIFANSVNVAYAVMVNGKKVAIVKDKDIINEVVKEAVKVKGDKYGQAVTTKDKVTIEKIRAKEYQVASANTLKKRLVNSLKYYTKGIAIEVNGQTKITAKNQKQAQEILDSLSKPKLEKGQLTTVKFLEKVNLVPNKEVSLDQIKEVADAVEYIKNGGQKVETYQVQDGDNLWTIARSHDMRVKELQAANPELRTEKINIGQVLKLVKIQPLINVEATVKVTSLQKIPYNVEYKKDKTLKSGKEQVKQKGSDGSREMTYQLVMRNGVEIERKQIGEKVIAKPVTQVVLQGNKPTYVASRKSKRTILVASRGDYDGGNLAWPASGGITSGFGSRWGRMHTGLDIDGNTGDPIRAAESGVVVDTGWNGAYGNMIIIRHGGGLTTRYGHLSKISVSVGDQVARGEVIGRMGSTGRSTGSHLHFETLQNGSFRNPISYLR